MVCRGSASLFCEAAGRSGLCPWTVCQDMVITVQPSRVQADWLCYDATSVVQALLLCGFCR